MKWLAVVLAFVTIPAIAMDVMFLLGPYGGGPVVIKPGDAVEESGPSSIEELSIASKDWRLVAYKWSETDKDFQIAFFRRGESMPETCRSGEPFLRLASKISTLRAVRVLSENQTRSVVEDDYNHRMTADLIMVGRNVFSHWDIYRQKGDRSKLLVVTDNFRETAFEPAWNVALFDNFAKGCGFLGGTAPP